MPQDPPSKIPFKNEDFEKTLQRLRTFDENTMASWRDDQHLKKYNKKFNDVSCLVELHHLLIGMLNIRLYPTPVMINTSFRKLNDLGFADYSNELQQIATQNKMIHMRPYILAFSAMAKTETPNVVKFDSLLSEAKHAGIEFDAPTQKSEGLIDFHGLTFGATYFWLRKEFSRLSNENNQPVKLVLIYGKGNHSELLDDEIHPLKVAVLKAIQDAVDVMICAEECAKNPGRLLVELQLQNKLTAQIEPIAQAPHATFFPPAGGKPLLTESKISPVKTNDSVSEIAAKDHRKKKR